MWTETDEGRAFIEELSRNMVADVAPEELDMFDELADEYYEDPSPPDASAEASDDALGFGMSEMLIAATPAALAVAGSVVSFVVQEAIGAASDEALGAVLRRVFKKEQAPADAPPPTLTKEQLEQVNRLALEQAQAFGLDPDTAQKMAQALVGTLAIS